MTGKAVPRRTPDMRAWIDHKLDLSTRTGNTLWRAKLVTVGELLALGEAGVFALDGMGVTGMADINTALSEAGYPQLAKDPDRPTPLRQPQRSCPGYGRGTSK